MSSLYENDAWREQAEIDRQSRRRKEERILRLARAEPELPTWAMVERFGWPEHTIGRLLKAHGLRREPEGIAAYRNGRRTG